MTLPNWEAEAAFAPVISEIMAINGTTLADEDGDFSDWIEIQNIGETTGDLAGWHLSDNPSNLTCGQKSATPLFHALFVFPSAA